MSSDSKKAGQPRRSPVETLAAMLAHVPLEGDDDPESTSSDRRWARDQVAEMRRQLDARRRARTPVPRPPGRAVPIPPALLGLDRRALIERLNAISVGAEVQFVHWQTSAISDDDLRQLLAVALERGAT